MGLDEVFRRGSPVLPVRGAHLDLKGVPPTPERLVDLLRVFAALRYNLVLVEWEDTFPWTVDERFRCETAYTPDEVERFRDRAAELGIELVPLVQCLGHMETPLGTPGYEHLREVPDRADVLNPLAPGARELVETMVADVLRLLPDVKRFHLGGDEAWCLGEHPDTRAYIAEHGKGALYLRHVEPILDKLASRGIRPLLWHDMMRAWDAEALRRLGRKADLVVWGYSGHPAETGDHVNPQIVERFRAHGVTLWGAGAYKGAERCNSDLPDFDERGKNALGWAEFASEHGMRGVIATAWSRCNTAMVQMEPIVGALDCLVNVAVVLHDGEPPAGGREACVEALEALGERERFERARAVLSRLTETTRRGWSSVRGMHEELALAADDPRRAVSLKRSLEDFGGLLDEAERVRADLRAALSGLVPDLWIDRYSSERLTPLRAQYEKLTQSAQRRLGERSR